MRNDRLLNLLLLAIAVGLRGNLLLPFVVPREALAQGGNDVLLQRIEDRLRRINSELAALTAGACINPKLCK